MTTSINAVDAVADVDHDLASPPGVASINDTVRRTVKALLSFYDVAPERLSPILTISKATVYRRLNGESPFTAGESAVLAQYFGSTVEELFTGSVKFDAKRNISYYKPPTRLAIVADTQVARLEDHAATTVAQLPTARPTDRDDRLRKVA